MQVSAAVRVMPVPAVSIWPMKTVVFRVGLELLDDVSAILFFDVAVDGHGFHSGGAERLFAQSLDLVNLRDEPGEYYQLLFAIDHVVLEDVLQGVKLPPTDQLRLDGVILRQEAAR